MALERTRAAALQILRGRAAAKALELQGLVKEETPVGKSRPGYTGGRLRQSIGVKRINENTWRVGTNVEYAPYVEFGTRFMAPRAMFRKASAKLRAGL